MGTRRSAPPPWCVPLPRPGDAGAVRCCAAHTIHPPPPTTTTTPQVRETGIDQTLYRGRKMSSVKRFVEASRGNSSAVITRGVT
jgi:hypothetical protein